MAKYLELTVSFLGINDLDNPRVEALVDHVMESFDQYDPIVSGVLREHDDDK